MLVEEHPDKISQSHHCVCVHAKAKARNQQTSNEKRKMQKACERGIKQTSMIDTGSIAYGRRDDKPQDKQKKKKQESKKANRHARKQEIRQTSKKANKMWCL